MSAVDRILAAQTFERGTYLGLCRGTLPKKGEPAASDIVNGEYVLKIERVLYKPTSPKIGECVVVEFTVETSNSEGSPVGSKRSWVQKLSNASGVSGYKGFLYAALGAKTTEQRATADKVLPKILTAIEQNQPHALIGRKVRCTVAPYMCQNGQQAGNWITLNNYSAFED